MNPAARSRLRRVLGGITDLEATLRRAEVQLDFARAFVQVAPGLPGGAAANVDRWTAKLDAFDASLGLDGLRALVAEMEADLVAIGQLAKTFTIHCIGHGHIDMNWMWSWPETVSTTHDTFASVLHLMTQFPQVTYSQSQTSVYAAIEKYHPAMFEEIRKRVAEGRWEVVASHWVEGDKNLASGEALCRHLLQTRAYFQDRFGLSPEDVPIDLEPDTFGHAHTLPMINALGAVKYYYCCRPGGGSEHERVGEFRPPLFHWEAPDGSRILVNRETTWYNSYVNNGDNVALPMVEVLREVPGLHDWMNLYGIGNHGGGPTRAEVEYLIELDGYPIYPAVKFGTVKGFFERVEQSNLTLPVLDHELNFEFTGCYTSQSLIKQANRHGENFCVEAESLAALSGLERRGALREAWINVLFNQFHDILPGSGVRETREHARALFQETGAITGAVKRDALGALIGRVDTLALLPDTPCASEERALGSGANRSFEAGAGQGARETGFSRAGGGGRRFRAFVVYNPCAWTRSEPITVTLYDTDFDEHSIVGLDETGHAHPTRSLGKSSDWGHDKITLLFYARDVPGMGYRTYLFCEGTPAGKASEVHTLDSRTFETATLRCRFEPHHGALASLGAHGASAGIGAPELPFGVWNKIVESPIGMNAWVLGDPGDPQPLEATSFETRGYRRDGATGIVLIPDAFAGHAEWRLKVPDTRMSNVHLQALVHPLAPRVDFEAEIDWREIGDGETGCPGLVVRFDGINASEALFETPFGVIARTGLKGDLPSLRFVHAFDRSKGHGVTILQDSKYAFQTDANGIQMRVVRSSNNPDPMPEVAQSRLRYATVFHTTPPTRAELVRLGAAFNHPFIVTSANLQSGDHPAHQGFATVTTPNVVLTALKQAEHREGLVLRLVEYEGLDTQAEVLLAPHLLPANPKVHCVDLMERPIDGDATLQGHRLTVPLRPHGMTTVLISAG